MTPFKVLCIRDTWSTCSSPGTILPPNAPKEKQEYLVIEQFAAYYVKERIMYVLQGIPHAWDSISFVRIDPTPEDVKEWEDHKSINI